MLSEADIIKGCRKYESTAQRFLHNLYAKKMYAVCCRYISDRDEAKDILQEGFIKVFQNFESYNEQGPLGAWIRRIMVNTALSVLRKKKNHLFLSLNEEKGDALLMTEEYVYEEDESVFQHSFTQDELLASIEALPEGLKLIFNLFAIEKYSHKEIGELLNIKEGTSRIRLLRARKELQEKLVHMLSERKVKVS